MWLALRLGLSGSLAGLAIYLTYVRDRIFGVVMLPIAVIIAVAAIVIDRRRRRRASERASCNTVAEAESEERSPTADPQHLVPSDDIFVSKAIVSVEWEEPGEDDYLYEEFESWGTPLAAGLSIHALIDYQDGDGDRTERAITIRSVYGERRSRDSAHLTIVQAYCHMRKAMRTFYVSRMDSIADVQTGEVGFSPAAWIAWRAGIRAKNIRAVRPY